MCNFKKILIIFSFSLFIDCKTLLSKEWSGTGRDSGDERGEDSGGEFGGESGEESGGESRGDDFTSCWQRNIIENNNIFILYEMQVCH